MKCFIPLDFQFFINFCIVFSFIENLIACIFCQVFIIFLHFRLIVYIYAFNIKMDIYIWYSSPLNTFCSIIYEPIIYITIYHCCFTFYHHCKFWIIFWIFILCSSGEIKQKTKPFITTSIHPVAITKSTIWKALSQHPYTIQS